MSPRDVQSTFLGRTQFMFYQGRLMSSHNVQRKILGRTQIVFYRRRLNMSPRTILRQILGRTHLIIKINISNLLLHVKMTYTHIMVEHEFCSTIQRTWEKYS